MRPTVFILEGAWDDPHEAPQILPYFTAYANSHGLINLQHRTFRCLEDIIYYVKEVPKGAKSFFYFACHGDEGNLIPAGLRSRITMSEVDAALSHAKESSIEFVHFGCCGFVKSANRRRTLKKMLDAGRAGWVSGYTRTVDWLPSTLLDLALIDSVYVPWYKAEGRRASSIVSNFTADYEQLARNLGFSGIYAHADDEHLFPKRLTSDE